jgi:hypothetical protein
MLQLSIVQGSAADWPIQGVNRGNLSAPVFKAGDTLTATVWAGDAQTAICEPQASWYTRGGTQNGYEQAQALVAMTEVQSAALSAGSTYQMEVWLQVFGVAGRKVCFARASISVLAAPGLGTAPPVYCSLDDMAIQCAWIGQFQDLDNDQAGFAQQRGMAREWFDMLILRAAPQGGMGQITSRQDWWSWGYSGVDPRSGTGLAVDRVLTDHLAANRLMTTTPQGKAVVRACAMYAVALVLRSQPDDSNRKQADVFMRRAQAEATMIVAEVDINADGRPEYAVALGVTNTRFA